MRLVVVLHAHLPWVKASEPWTVEERWLHEALWESYLPALEVVERLGSEGVKAPITLSLSPTLLAMWGDATLRARFDDHLSAVAALAERVLSGTVRAHYRVLLERARAIWGSHGVGLGRAFGELNRRGRLELITTAATHGLLPALAPRAEAIDAQLGLGRDLFERATGVCPSAMWLPECAIDAEVERALARLDVAVTVVAEHASRFARPDPGKLGGGPTPLVSPHGVVMMPRHRAATLAVWSPTTGYPGDGCYREFHRDVGHEREHVGPFGRGTMTGLKPYRVDGGTYDPAAGEARAHHDADDLLDRLCREAAPLTLMAFDAELFGHWWHEGWVFLEHLLRQAGSRGVDVVTLTEAAGRGAWPVAEPAASTWGRGGDSRTWLGPTTAGHWRLVHGAWDLARRAWRDGSDAAASVSRAALLLQASDWPFLIDGRGSAAYARARVAELVAAADGRRAVAEPFEEDLVELWVGSSRSRVVPSSPGEGSPCADS